eukprot:scaffold8139_cov363-Prasinococcus_capsulatus_cf.AAC.3
MSSLELFRMPVNSMEELPSPDVLAGPSLTWYCAQAIGLRFYWSAKPCTLACRLALAGNPVFQAPRSAHVTMVRPHPLAQEKEITRVDEVSDAEFGGASGEVFRVVYDGEVFAAKFFKAAKGEISPDGQADDELLVTCSLFHPHLAHVNSLITRNKEVIGMMMEVIPGAPLAKKPLDSVKVLRCRYDPDHKFSTTFITNLVTGLAKGLAHIHSLGICHGDLYAHNILVRPGSGRATLIDFGAAFFYNRNTELGELLERRAVPRSQIEVRAFGILLEELLENSVDEGQKHEAETREKLKELASKCLGVAVRGRPSFSEVVDRMSSLKLGSTWHHVGHAAFEGTADIEQADSSHNDGL